MTNYRDNILINLADGAKNKKMLAEALSINPSGFSNGGYAEALKELIEQGIVISNYQSINGRIGICYELSGNSDIPSDEEVFMKAIGDFLQSKKSSMIKEFEVKLNERDYYEKLCKDYKEKIDQLETQLANKSFKLW
jgi:hypothetical protein